MKTEAFSLMPSEARKIFEKIMPERI